jgi:hypothetical protein
MKKLIFNIRPVHARICKKLDLSIEDYAEELKRHLAKTSQGKSLEEILEEHPYLELGEEE